MKNFEIGGEVCLPSRPSVHTDEELNLMDQVRKYLPYGQALPIRGIESYFTGPNMTKAQFQAFMVKMVNEGLLSLSETDRYMLTGMGADLAIPAKTLIASQRERERLEITVKEDTLTTNEDQRKTNKHNRRWTRIAVLISIVAIIVSIAAVIVDYLT